MRLVSQGKFFLICSFLFISFLVSAQDQGPKFKGEDYYFTGLELLQKEKYNAARIAFEKYIQQNPNDIKAKDAQYYVAYSALNLYHSDGETLVENFIRENPNHTKASQAYYELGNFYYRDKNYEKAITYYEKADQSQLTKDELVEMQFRTGYSYFSLKQFDKALQPFNQIKRTENQYTHAASYYAGYIEFRNADYDRALIDLKKAEQNDAYASIVPYMITNVYYKQRQYDELIRYSNEVLNARQDLKNKDEINLLVAEAHYRKGNYQQAAKFFEDYIKNAQTTPEPAVRYRMAYSNYIAGNTQAAIDGFKQLAANKDTLGQFSSYYLGIVYLKEGNRNFAVTAFNQARATDYSSQIKEQAAFSFAKVNYELGNYTEAISALSDYIKQYPNGDNTPEANEILSEAYLNSSNYNMAIKHIESLPDKSNTIKRAYQKVTYLKGTELYNNADYPQAVQMFDKSLQYPMDPEYTAMANYWKGEAYSTGRKYEEAMQAYNTVFAVAKPGGDYYTRARYGMGYTLYNTKQYDRALVNFREYVGKGSNSQNQQYYNDALIRLADCYYAAKDYNNALTYYDRAIQQNNPDRDYAYFQKGTILGLKNNYQEAKNTLDIVTSRYPQSRYVDNAIYQKAELDVEQGNYQSAIANFSSIIDKKQQSGLVPHALLNRAVSNYNLKNYDQTAGDYKRILDEYPTHKVTNSAIIGLQEVLTQQGKTDQFQPYLAKYKKANPENKAVEGIEFESAKSLYFNQKYNRAITTLEDYIRTYPNTPQITEARYYMAESYYRLNQTEKAIEFYFQVINGSPSEFINRSVNRVAELQYRKGNFEDAINYYRRLVSIASTKKEQYNGWSGLMQSFYMLASYDSVDHYANIIIEKGNVNANAQNQALVYLGKSAYSRGDYDSAIDHFLSALNTAKDENGAEAQYLLADIFHKQKDYKKSIETLYNLNKTFGTYELWLGKSFLLIADNYIEMNEFFQAKATLNSIVEKSPNKDIVAEANKRLELIRTREKDKKSNFPDDNDSIVDDQLIMN